MSTRPSPPPAQAERIAAAHRVRDTCICLHLQRAARAVARRFDDALRPLGLTNGQFSILVSLNRAQAPGIVETSRLLGMDRTTITAALKSLERRSLVEVRVVEGDRRRRSLHLTARGRRLVAAALPLWAEAHADTERALTVEPEALRRELRTIGSTPPPASRATRAAAQAAPP